MNASPILIDAVASSIKSYKNHVDMAVYQKCREFESNY